MLKKIEDTSYIKQIKTEVGSCSTFSLEKFWKQFSKEKNPLWGRFIESEKAYEVTLLFRGNQDTYNLYFIPEIEDGKTLDYDYQQIEKTDIWYICLQICDDIRFEYALSINDDYADNWELRFENLIYDEWSRSFLEIKDDEEVEHISNIQMPNAPQKVWSEMKKPTKSGQLIVHHLKLKKFEERRKVQVYLPPDYTDADLPYSFILFNDGEEYIDLLNAVTVMDNLISEKKIRKIVGIFVDSTDDREEELACDKTFEKALIEEILPWVERHYHIQLENNNNAVAGLSLGGFMACYLGIEVPKVFSFVLSQSGAFWAKQNGDSEYEGECWIIDQYRMVERVCKKYFFDIGILEEKETMIELNHKMANICREKESSVKLIVFKGGHDYLTWGETLAEGLLFLFASGDTDE